MCPLEPYPNRYKPTAMADTDKPLEWIASSYKLMDCLNRLGYDIEIKVRPASAPIGHLTLATA